VRFVCDGVPPNEVDHWGGDPSLLVADRVGVMAEVRAQLLVGERRSGHAREPLRGRDVAAAMAAHVDARISA
jgi:hypothetical protein